MGWIPGQLVAGRYRLVEIVGQGGMGAVWSARHISLESEVAIKQISPRWLDTPQAVSRFLREGRTVASLKTPHVVHVFDHGVEGDVPYIVMELLRGESLAQRLDRVGQLSAAETLRMVVHVARALAHAHEAGVVHRDLKPDNVFLVSNDDEEIAKVIDFGIAKVARVVGHEPTLDTETGALVGTPFYMSPEQARGREVDHRTDLWALGVIAFECMAGRRPFAGDSIGDVAVSICSDAIPRPSDFATVPPGFDAWFARAVKRNLEERFQSAKEMAAQLREVVREAGAAGLSPVNLRSVSASAETLPAGEASSLAETVPASVDGAVGAATPAPATLAGVHSRAGEAVPAARGRGSGSSRVGRWVGIAGALGLLLAALTIVKLLPTRSAATDTISSSLGTPSPSTGAALPSTGTASMPAGGAATSSAPAEVASMMPPPASAPSEDAGAPPVSRKPALVKHPLPTPAAAPSAPPPKKPDRLSF